MPDSRLIAGLLLCGCSAATPSAPANAPAPAVGVEDPGPAPESVAVDVGGASAVLPTGVTSFGAAVHDGGLYVLGGYFGKPHAYSKEGQSGDLLRLDLADGTWTKHAGVEPAQSIILVATPSGLVRVGGMRADNSEGEDADLRSVDNVQRFDPASGGWSDLPALPKQRSSHDATVVGDTLFVVGGWTLNKEGPPTWATTVATLDLSNPDAGWTEHEAPFQRRALATGAVNGKIIALGGISSDRKLSTQLDVFDPKTKKWSRGPDFPGAGFGVAAVASGDAVYASGSDGAVFRWSDGDKEWTPTHTLAFPRFFHRMAATDGELVVLGGIRGMKNGKRVRPIERLPLQRKPSVLAFELESPMPSKNRQGIAMIGDQLLAFGGNKSLGQHDFEPKFFADSAHALDLSLMRWSKAAAFPAKRQTIATSVLPSGKVIALGGFGHDGEVARSHPEVFSYDPATGEWSPAGALPGLGRTQFGFALYKDTAYVFGGLDYDPKRGKKDQFRHETAVLKAKVGEQLRFKKSKIELRSPRRAFGGAVLGSRYLLIGGMKENFALVDSCDAWDFERKQWERVACPDKPRLSPQLVTLGERVYLAAGSSRPAEGEKLAPNKALEVYNPVDNTWSTVIDELPVDPKHMRMVGYGNRLLLFSTHNDKGKAKVLLIDPGGPLTMPPKPPADHG